MTTYAILPEPLPLALPDGWTVPASFAPAADRAWRTAATKVRGLVERHPDRFPLYTQGGAWAVDAEAWTNWCEGFLGGQLWMLADHTGDPWFRERAEHYSRLVEHRKDDRNVHDLGFLFWSTWRRWYEATGDPARDDVVVHAGRTAASRFNELGRYLPSFLAPDSLFIDIMMNVGIIFHAARRTGDPDLARIAHEHCLTTRRVLVRGDGSASHEGVFDLTDGRFLRQTTQQGYSDDGSWARGQAWALYGFGTVYRHTGDRRFLDTARACADFYIERTGDRLVPPNDWEEPDPERPYESSAAAAAAGGLWQLAGLEPDSDRARGYADYAVRILTRLCEDDFLAHDDPAWEGLLKHGSYHEAKGLGVDESVMWGDYWFLDAIAAVDAVARPAN
ncbi:glycoside hydrolase family 88 protein [Streptomyces sporangiiformans]|uniref:Glycosyl hydrolase n=1 Tax=Streptomyces sporangiiformans TaxID=2315329 RepID=A0A505DRM3_9ACTN|nr:glycoside hydrolase family 88 protein [Streptomyces sporangiiformans]TPQ23825.1 glycosyl hydrolase [Streptomyces sporangiiformans]